MKQLFRKTKVALLLKTLTISVIFLFASCGGKSVHFTCGFSENTQIGINHLQPLVNAMEKYKLDNGRYPENGLDLIPKYIDKIPFIASEKQFFDESKMNILRNDNLFDETTSLAEDGSYFRLKFLTKDNRICLFGGRNNICEYTSEKKVWSCYQ